MEFQIKEGFVETELDFGKLTISPNDTEGFRPFQLMIASITSCSGMVFKKILKKQRIEIDQLSIHSEIERNESEANRIEKLSLEFIVQGSDLNKDKLMKSLAIARKNCAMIRSVEASIQIEETITIKE